MERGVATFWTPKRTTPLLEMLAPQRYGGENLKLNYTSKCVRSDLHISAALPIRT